MALSAAAESVHRREHHLTQVDQKENEKLVVASWVSMAQGDVGVGLATGLKTLFRS
jgi:hypothetical protein